MPGKSWCSGFLVKLRNWIRIDTVFSWREFEVDTSTNSTGREQWSSPIMFVLVTTGAVVGLGNFWRFPSLAAEFGGGAYLSAYLLFIVVIGFPLMLAEVTLGRSARKNSVQGLRELGHRGGAPWFLAALLGMLGALCVLAMYSVVAGWSMAYMVRTASGVFEGVTAEGARSIFDSFISDPEKLLGWHTLFVVITTTVTARGIRSGLEPWLRIMMPAQALLLLLLLFHAWQLEAFEKAFEVVFSMEFEKLSVGALLAALSQAFFTLSLGMGVIMIYGSYLPEGVSVTGSVVSVLAFDLLATLLAAMVLLSLLMNGGLSMAEGPALIFQALPVVLGDMSGGAVLGSLFFLMLLLVAWSSGLSLMEPAVAWLCERFGIGRGWSAAAVGVAVWILGLGVMMSFSDWSFTFSIAGVKGDNGLFDVLDFLTAAVLLPVGGIFLSLFAGWVLPREALLAQLALGTMGLRWWYLMTRFVVPLGLLLVSLSVWGVI